MNEQKKVMSWRAVTVNLPKDVAMLLESIKSPKLTMGETIAEIVYKELKAYVAAQKIIEQEAEKGIDPNAKAPDGQLLKDKLIDKPTPKIEVVQTVHPTVNKEKENRI